MSDVSRRVSVVLTLMTFGVAFANIGGGCAGDDDDGSDEDDWSDDDDDSADCLGDEDGDGFDICEDCDDFDLTINPAADEIKDGVDNNCNAEIDEGLDDDTDDDAGDDDADDDDMSDDDAGDDDADDDACDETAVCTYLVEDCSLEEFYGDAAACETQFYDSCEADPETYLTCMCLCAASDVECADPDAIVDCVAGCYFDLCI